MIRNKPIKELGTRVKNVQDTNKIYLHQNGKLLLSQNEACTKMARYFYHKVKPAPKWQDTFTTK